MHTSAPHRPADAPALPATNTKPGSFGSFSFSISIIIRALRSRSHRGAYARAGALQSLACANDRLNNRVEIGCD